jgi:hypothetical protein
MATKTNVFYENNPFMIGIEGLKLLFGNAKNVGIYSIALTAGMFVLAIIFYVVMVIIELATGSNMDTTNQVDVSFNPDATGLLVVTAAWVVGTLLYLAVSLLLFGPLEYTAAMLAKGKQVGLGEAFKATLNNFGAYYWLYILFIVKIFLWSLLLIIPGIIMFNRYVLSGTVFFAEGKRGNAAIKRSSELVKGAWLTTYGGAWVWNMISQGLATIVFWPATMAVLYRQLARVTDASKAKPAAHILSWLILLIPIAIAVLYLVFMILLFTFIATAPTAP